MKHIVLDSTFSFSSEPFPAFRANLVFGRNKRDFSFIPTQINPIITYKVISLESFSKKIEKESSSKEECENFIKENASKFKYGLTIAQSEPTLPTNNFKIIKTKEKGTIMIVPGNDDSNRALVFLGCSGGFRGGVSIIENTSNIIKECHAANNCDSKMAVIAIFEVGKKLIFKQVGRRHNHIVEYTWDGENINSRQMTFDEYKQEKELNSIQDCVEL